ncbi:hypothetical protein Patl1_24414 [Pistacia atlantica]|uniref:Uncharacterized protein n=2 Tax=Pistacia TaxID=55512 RepID=A0ACC0ZZL7_9ROSI|nr:hypothetical protein Patl1_24414 [Pistacia atlantica]
MARTSRFSMEGLSKENLLMKERFDQFDRIYVMCKDDEVIKLDFSFILYYHFASFTLRHGCQVGIWSIGNNTAYKHLRAAFGLLEQLGSNLCFEWKGTKNLLRLQSVVCWHPKGFNY